MSSVIQLFLLKFAIFICLSEYRYINFATDAPTATARVTESPTEALTNTQVDDTEGIRPITALC